MMRFFKALMLGVVITSGPLSAVAAETAPAYWDCWVEENNAEPTSINCIRDPDSPNYKPPGDGKADGEEALIEHIHNKIHGGDTTNLGRFIRDNVKVFHRDSIWGIYIFSEPYDTSWDEERPETLVRALLCPGKVECVVMINRPQAVK